MIEKKGDEKPPPKQNYLVKVSEITYKKNTGKEEDIKN